MTTTMTLGEEARKSTATERARTVAELGRAVLFRSAIYVVLLYFLLLAFRATVDYGFLAVTVFAVVVMHEAFHMIGMEALRTDHSESFRLLAVGYAAVNLTNRKALVAVALPFIILLPFGFLLTLTRIPAFMAVGWSIIIMHAILLPIELTTIRSKSAE